MALRTVLHLVADDAQVRHRGVLHCDREGRIGEVGDVELTRTERRDHEGRAGVARDLGLVGLAVVLHHILLLVEDGRPVADRHHVGHADLERIGAGGIRR
jgi:hypothetical protein